VPGRRDVLGFWCPSMVRERRLGALIRAFLRLWNCKGVSASTVLRYGTEQIRR
jgi:hypothetical protein